MEPSQWLNILPLFLQGLLTATGIGLVIGLEREHNSKRDKVHLGGLRTFPLVSIFGYLTGFLALGVEPVLLPVATAGFAAFAGALYVMQARIGKYGITTVMAVLLVFLLGVMVAHGYVAEALSVVVVATLLLSLKDEFHSFVARITERELLAFIKFFVIALLVMPNLPEKSFGPDGLLQYRSVGWVVVIVSSLGFAGYLLLKFGGMQRGIMLTALVGGLFSSTMIAWIFGGRSKEHPTLARHYGSGIVLSSTVMYVRVVCVTALFNPPLALRLLTPCGLMLMVSLFWVWLYTRQKAMPEEQSNGKIPLGNPLDLKNALYFGVLYVGVAYFLYYSRAWMGDSGAYLTSAVSGVADIDAITINTAQWALRSGADLRLAARMVVVAMLSNSVFKTLVAVSRADASIRRMLLLSFGSVIAAGLLWLIAL